jgi:hypothetical protein
VAQLGARFHGMEEVVGSIPTRSTNQPNNLARTSAHKRGVCVMVCVITSHFAAIGEGFHRCALAATDGQINNILNASHKLSRLDTIHLKIGDSTNTDELVLLAPTHPIKLLWVLQYQQLLFSLAEKLDGVSETEAAAMVNRKAHEQILSLNIPPAIAFKNDEIYVNSDNLDLYWSILPRGTTS